MKSWVYSAKLETPFERNNNKMEFFSFFMVKKIAETLKSAILPAGDFHIIEVCLLSSL